MQKCGKNTLKVVSQQEVNIPSGEDKKVFHRLFSADFDLIPKF